ncbi:MAG: hypothetical protein R8M38_10320 [Mariprofundaceae bacterium]
MQTFFAGKHKYGYGIVGALSLGLIMTLLWSESDSHQIHVLLDARDVAISERDISHYSPLIADDYMDQKVDKIATIAKLVHLFDRFDVISMQSFDRRCVVQEQLAQCQQSYKMSVRYDQGEWHHIAEQELITFALGQYGWKIKAGI